MDRDLYFTAGRFATLHGINKRTLHYYDEIGLFSPAHKGENGYRYYTYLQSPTLEMLLTLRELGMSIEDISQYLKDRSTQAVMALLDGKSREIDSAIHRLKAIKRLLADKHALLALTQTKDLSTVEIVQLPTEYLLLTRSGAGTYDERDFSELLSQTQKLRPYRMFNQRYGTMLPVEDMAAQRWDAYACFFTQIQRPIPGTDLFVKPSGTYLRAYCVGSWDKLPDTYARIMAFAAAHALHLKGHAFEEGINEMAIGSMDDYVTQITVSCQ